MTEQFRTMADMVTRLKSTNSNNDKKQILNDYVDNEFIKKAFLYAMSPYKKYGVHEKTARKMASKLQPTFQFDSIFDLLDALNNRDLTGHSAIAAVLGYIEQNKEYEELIYALIDNNLKIRVSSTTINKIFGDIVPSFNVALAVDYYPEYVDFEKETWFASRKLDGVRCLIFTGPNNTPIALSRSGKSFDTIQKVLDEIKLLNSPNTVFDGEICLINPDGTDNFNGVMSEIRRKNHTIENPKFKIFDMITQTDFDNESSTTLLSERLVNLTEKCSILKDSNTVEVLQQEQVSDMNIFNSWLDESRTKKWEGFMVRKDTTYKGKRSKDLLKVKEMMDDEYVIVDTVPGNVRYIKYIPQPDGSKISTEVEEEMVSNLVIEHKGNLVDVGSGLSMKQRQAFYKDNSLIVGKTCTIQFFEYTVNKQGKESLRFPVLKHVFENGRDI